MSLEVHINFCPQLDFVLHSQQFAFKMNREYVMFYILKILGLTPFTIKSHRCRKHSDLRDHLTFATSSLSKIYNTIILIIIIATQISYMYMYLYVRDDVLSDTTDVSNLISTTGKLIAIITILFPFASYHSDLAQVLNELERIECELSNVSYCPNKRSKMIMFFEVTYLISGLGSAMTIYLAYREILIICERLVTLLLISNFLLLYGRVVNMTVTQFTILNSHLENITIFKSRTFVPVFNVSKNQQDGKMYSDLTFVLEFV